MPINGVTLNQPTNQAQTTHQPHSAISSWNGFIYQGKVALYVVINMLNNGRGCEGFKLKLENLDDFAVFDCNEKVISSHQVKATAASNRSSYIKALSKASEVYSEACDEDTKRYFHVSSELDDFRDYDEAGLTVAFYNNHENNNFIGLDQIETYIKKMISNYLDQSSLINTDELITFKYNKLLSLVDSRVNYIHAVNQDTEATQLEATDQNPIFFQEVKTILESTYPEDEIYFLEEFRRSFIDILNGFADYRDNLGLCIDDLIACKNTISILDQEKLQQLYFSFDPTESDIKKNHSNNDLNTYMDILCTLDKHKLITEFELPHYQSFKATSFLPTGFGLNNSTSAWTLEKFRQNIEDIEAHPELINLFFEYDNFIASISGQGEPETVSINIKATHDRGINDLEFNPGGSCNVERDHLIRKKLVRFVSTDIAEKELEES